ncbi:hypothetical protein T03_7928, partial [Trichinella britovi]
MQYQLNNVMYVPPQTGDVTAAWWCHLGKIGLRLGLCRGTASSGQSVPSVSGIFAPGGVPGMSVAPLTTLSCRAFPSCGRASVFLARPTTRSRSGGKTTHLHGGRTGILPSQLRFHIVPHELVHTADALSGFPDVSRSLWVSCTDRFPICTSN